MFRFDEYVERWAQQYKGLAHSESHPAFFRVNSEYTLDEFISGYTSIDYPIVCVITHLEGVVDGSKSLDNGTFRTLFLAPGKFDDYKDQADAKYKCKDLMHKFIMRVRFDKKRLQANPEQRLHPLAMVDIDNLRYDMIGPVLNSWHCLSLDLSAKESFGECYSDTDYIDPAAICPL